MDLLLLSICICCSPLNIFRIYGFNLHPVCSPLLLLELRSEHDRFRGVQANAWVLQRRALPPHVQLQTILRNKLLLSVIRVRPVDAPNNLSCERQPLNSKHIIQANDPMQRFNALDFLDRIDILRSAPETIHLQDPVEQSVLHEPFVLYVLNNFLPLGAVDQRVLTRHVLAAFRAQH